MSVYQPTQQAESTPDCTQSLYLCGGCFWGMEKALQNFYGVTATQVGYANGETENPSYQEVCTGKTGHKECVKVNYDPTKISLETLLEVYFICIHPEQHNAQGNDFGTQYQEAVYVTKIDELTRVNDYFTNERKKHSLFFVESDFLHSFYPAEEYHQQYLAKNPQGYCHIQRKEMNAIQALNQRLQGEKYAKNY